MGANDTAARAGARMPRLASAGEVARSALAAARTSPAFATWLSELEAREASGRTAGGLGEVVEWYLGLRVTVEHDHWAALALAEGNLRLVLAVAACYDGQGVPFEDVVAAGHIGLLEAALDYDPERGRFTTHAAWKIWRACRRQAHDHGRAIRLPEWLQTAGSKLARAEQQAAQEGASTDLASVAARAAVKLSVAAEWQRAPQAQPLSAVEGDQEGHGERDDDHQDGLQVDEQGRAYGEAARWPEESSTEARVLSRERVAALHAALATLSERERLALTYSYGLGGSPVLSLAAMAEAIGCTLNQVRTAIARGERRLRLALGAPGATPPQRKHREQVARSAPRPRRPAHTPHSA